MSKTVKNEQAWTKLSNRQRCQNGKNCYAPDIVKVVENCQNQQNCQNRRKCLIGQNGKNFV